MIISHNWLQEYCPHDLAAHQLADRLSQAGLCVETYEPRGGDWMLDVEVTSNRPDCLSHIGIAREVAAFTGRTVLHPEIEINEDEGVSFEERSSVQVECPRLCPHYTARLISGVSVEPSPEWLQSRLETCGIRPVNNIVDITNYVLLESGQPLHAFDLSLLNEGRIVVRQAQAGEKIITIDGSECELSPEMCVIADATSPVAVAGVMGGLESEIGNSTTDILLESARFTPTNIRRTSRSLGLSSESSYRFERGVDPENVERASRRAAQLILDIAGGSLASGLGNVRSDSPETPEVTLRFPRLKHVLGIEVSPDEVEGIFDGLELQITQRTSSSLSVTVPSWRSDLRREVDLIEEVARIHGYDKISETTRIPVVAAGMTRRERCERRTRRLLTGSGFDEILSHSLVEPTELQTSQPWHDGDPIALQNPLTSDRTHMRLTNMGNLLEAKRVNAAHGHPRVDLFELGKVYLPPEGSDGQLAGEKWCLSVLTDRDEAFFVLKGLLDNLLETLHCKITPSEAPRPAAAFDPRKSLMLLDGERILACVGVLADTHADPLDFQKPPALMEIDFDLIVENARLNPTLQPLPKYPTVRRDIAVVVDETVRWRDLRAVIDRNAPKHLVSVDFFDIYRGEQVPGGKKSVAFSVALRSPDRTLTSDEADEARREIIGALEEELDAQLR